MLNTPHDPDADKVRTPTPLDTHLTDAAKQSKIKPPVPPSPDEPPLDAAYADARASELGDDEEVF
jgi:hypothetical protein